MRGGADGGAGICIAGEGGAAGCIGGVGGAAGFTWVSWDGSSGGPRVFPKGIVRIESCLNFSNKSGAVGT